MLLRKNILVSLFAASLISLSDYHFRWVYEGVIDDPYGEFFIAENKSLQKVLIEL